MDLNHTALPIVQTDIVQMQGNQVRQCECRVGQKCYLHTHSHSKLTLKEPEEEEDEEKEWDGKVIMGSEVDCEGWKREKM